MVETRGSDVTMSEAPSVLDESTARRHIHARRVESIFVDSCVVFVILCLEVGENV